MKRLSLVALLLMLFASVTLPLSAAVALFTGSVTVPAAGALTLNEVSPSLNLCTNGSKVVTTSGCPTSTQTAHGEIAFSNFNCTGATDASPTTMATISSQVLPTSPTGNWRLTVTLFVTSNSGSADFGIGTANAGSATILKSLRSNGTLLVTGSNAVASSDTGFSGGVTPNTGSIFYSALYASGATAGSYTALCGSNPGAANSGGMYWTAVPA